MPTVDDNLAEEKSRVFERSW